MPTNENEVIARWLDGHGHPALAWGRHDQCARRHEPLYYLKDDAVGTTGCYCGQCYQDYGTAEGYRVPETDAEIEAVRRVFREHPDGFMQKRPLDFLDPVHLLPAVEVWMQGKSGESVLELWVDVNHERAAVSTKITVGDEMVAFQSSSSLAGALRKALIAAIAAEKGHEDAGQG